MMYLSDGIVRSNQEERKQTILTDLENFYKPV